MNVVINSILFGLLWELSTFALLAETLNIKFEKLESTEGKICIAVYASKDSFLDKGQQLQGECIDIKSTSFDYKMELELNKEYAVVALHDANENKKMDFKMWVIPDEGVGKSGEQTFGKPKWEEAKFTFRKDGQTITIPFFYM